MRVVFILILLISLKLEISKAQNLVPNYSFEQYTTCPNAQDQIQYAVGWSKYSIVASTPDYYNACAPSSSFSVPQSSFNNQAAIRNCSAYAALIIWGASGNDREQIGIQLTQPLIIGQKYFLSFYTVMTESFAGGYYFGMPSNNIGMRLSTVDYNPINPAPIDNFAHLNSSTVISDSVNWVRISGSIVADSAYQFIILGNFFDDANTVTEPDSCVNCLNVQSYYLYDDICVSTDSLLANGGLDLIPCNVSVSEIGNDSDLLIYPNPVSVTITGKFLQNKNAILILYDVLGNIIFTKDLQESSEFIYDLTNLQSGYYYLKINSLTDNKLFVRKIIKL